MNEIVSVEIELFFFEVLVKHFSDNFMEIPAKKFEII